MITAIEGVTVRRVGPNGAVASMGGSQPSGRQGEVAIGQVTIAAGSDRGFLQLDVAASTPSIP